jgi:excisionase family DNA binding protein
MEKTTMKDKVPIHEKFNLTIPEAMEYFNIGRDKLYELAKEDGCEFVIHNGRNILIKRKLLEKYLEQISYI